MPTRRQLLTGSGLVAAGLYINHRGLRYPRLSFEPSPIDVKPAVAGLHFDFSGVFTLPSKQQIRLRAIEPEPIVLLTTESAKSIKFSLNNIARDALLKVQGQGVARVDESTEGLTRHVEIVTRSAQQVRLQWLLPQQQGIEFAVIGDTGAGLELQWCLQRAQSAGAKFLLHLGDFNYVDGEYEEAIRRFHNAPLPCYISIGNHDFNDSGLVYDKFIRELGPLNHTFQIAGTQFVNIDTAVNFMPAYAGQRGKLLDTLEQNKQRYSDMVCFTHRNFLDPRPHRDHTMSGVGERGWLAGKLRRCGADHLLSGHVHRSAELEYRGLKQWIVGEGLGFEDIVHERLVAKFLLGTAQAGKKVRYRWQALEMPWEMHTSPAHEEKLRREHPPAKLEWYRNKLRLS